MEGTEDYRDRLLMAAGIPDMMPLLDKAMLDPIRDVKHAQTLLSREERLRWELDLFKSVNIKLGSRSKQMYKPR